ncbi:MAG: arginine--tRNA ligase [Thermodesulfobacteriota bacterium]
MKDKVKKMVENAYAKAQVSGELPFCQVLCEVQVEEPKAAEHGDFASNFALTAARSLKKAPRAIAQAILAHLEDPDGILSGAEMAGPGFLNFHLKPGAWSGIVSEILLKGAAYGRSDLGKNQKVQVEFVSANPTGPLHVGHGRGAALGDTLARVLAFTGHDVSREYYINDSGRQISTLGNSVYLRIQELRGKKIDFPEDAYPGDYIREIAAEMERKGLVPDSVEDEAAMVLCCARYAAGVILAGIRSDLEGFGVTYDEWYSEQSLVDRGLVEKVIADCKEKGLIYEADGALWFATTRFGDEKDRVVMRQNGLTTYFASDIAYHMEKYERGFARVLDVWGADHHGYVARVSAAVQAAGHPAEAFRAVLITLVNLLRDGKPVAMGKRTGEFVTLSEVVNEVGKDAARFIFLSRHHESPLDFDLELAKKKTNDNPVFYVQYVHARISSISRNAAAEDLAAAERGNPDLGLLQEPEEVALMKKAGQFPEITAASATLLEPHRITYFLMELAAAFHAYYNRHRVLGDDRELSRARLSLVLAVRQVIKNGLALLNVTAPESM